MILTDDKMESRMRGDWPERLGVRLECERAERRGETYSTTVRVAGERRWFQCRRDKTAHD